MAKRQSKEQKQTVARVMHEFKHGELKTRGSGPRVKNPQQAIAIALHEAGATNQESAGENRRNLRRTEEEERRGETAEAEKEGKAAQNRTMKKATDGDAAGKSKAALYAEARRQDIAGRSRMSKTQLERALHR